MALSAIHHRSDWLTTKDMHVKVRHLLMSIDADIRDHTVAAVRNTGHFGDMGDHAVSRRDEQFRRHRAFHDDNRHRRLFNTHRVDCGL